MEQVYQPDLIDESLREGADQEFTINFQHGSNSQGKGYSTVGVQMHETGKRVYYITRDSRDTQSHHRHIEPVQKGIHDSCLNCGFHRSNWGTPFMPTDSGRECLRYNSPHHYATRRLPSDDNVHFQEGCICPDHKEYGTRAWVEYIIRDHPYSSVTFYADGKRITQYHYGDVIVIRENGTPTRTISREEFRNEQEGTKN